MEVGIGPMFGNNFLFKYKLKHDRPLGELSIESDFLSGRGDLWGEEEIGFGGRRDRLLRRGDRLLRTGNRVLFGQERID